MCRMLTGILMPVILCAPAQAFDAWGFHTNMSIQQATSEAVQLGYRVTVDNREEPFRTIGFYRTTAEGEAGIGYVGSFCNGSLIDITQFIEGTMGGFVDVLRELRHTYGRPSIDMSSDMLPDGRYRWLKVEFEPKQDDKVFVLVRTTPGSDTEFRVSVSHAIGGGCARAAR